MERYILVREPEDYPHGREPAIQSAIKEATRALLRYAIGNGTFWAVRPPAHFYDVPLRWHESTAEWVDGPLDFNLWANLDPERSRRLSIVRDFKAPVGRGRLWSCGFSEPGLAEYEGADFSSTHVSISTTGDVEALRRHYRRDDELEQVCIAQERVVNAADPRHAELVKHIGDALIQAVECTPERQVAFLRDQEIAMAPRLYAQRGIGRAALWDVLTPIT